MIALLFPDTEALLKGHVRGHVRRNGVAVRPHYRRAALFAAKKHKGQKRGDGKTPYIQHPVAVAKILFDEAGVRDDTTILAALLHDTIEDTDTTPEELAALFGKDVADVVLEVTNPPGAHGADKNRAQLEKAPKLSRQARDLKMADKLANLRDIIAMPPDWDLSRKQRYYQHAADMVNLMPDPHPILRQLFDDQYRTGLENLTASPMPLIRT